MILIPDTRADDYPDWGADDIDAITSFVGAYAYIAAEQAIDEVYAALELDDTTRPDASRALVGKVADKVADDVIRYCRERLAECERDGTWEVERVILERMRGNPAARLAN